MPASLSLRPKVVMFDLDGTLIDTMFKFADLAAEIMEREHGSTFAEARRGYLATSGIPFAQQLEVLHPKASKNAAISDEFEERKKLITRSTPMEQPAREALVSLRGLGCKIVLSSNTAQHFVDEFVAEESFVFDLALGFDGSIGLAKGKPHVERVLSKFEVVPKNILFVGDSLKDAELARENGTAFVGRLGTFDRAAFSAHDASLPVVDELVGLVEIVSAAATLAA